jgi:hypothetical protein
MPDAKLESICAKRMIAELKFTAWGVNSFMKSIPRTIKHLFYLNKNGLVLKFFHPISCSQLIKITIFISIFKRNKNNFFVQKLAIFSG